MRLFCSRQLFTHAGSEEVAELLVCSHLCLFCWQISWSVLGLFELICHYYAMPEMRFSCFSKDLSYWVMWKMKRVRELSNMGVHQSMSKRKKVKCGFFRGRRANSLRKSTKHQNFVLGREDEETSWEAVKEGAGVRGRLIVPEDLEELSQKQIVPGQAKGSWTKSKEKTSYNVLGTVHTPLGTIWCHLIAELKMCCPYSEDVSCIWAHMNSVLQQNWSFLLPKELGGPYRIAKWVSLTGKVNAVIVMNICTRTQLQLFSLKETTLNESRVLQNDMLVLIIQDIIISQGNNMLFYLLLIGSEVIIVLFGWLSKEQQSRFLLLPKTQSAQNYFS